MKIKTTDAAQSLGIHPAHLLLHVAQLDSALTFQDVWPEIEDAWVETVAATGGHRSASPRNPVQPSQPSPASPGLSAEAVHILDKLSRQGKYGKNETGKFSKVHRWETPWIEYEYHLGKQFVANSLSPLGKIHTLP